MGHGFLVVAINGFRGNLREQPGQVQGQGVELPMDVADFGFLAKS